MNPAKNNTIKNKINVFMIFILASFAKQFYEFKITEKSPLQTGFENKSDKIIINFWNGLNLK